MVRATISTKITHQEKIYYEGNLRINRLSGGLLMYCRVCSDQQTCFSTDMYGDRSVAHLFCKNQVVMETEMKHPI